MNSPEPKQSSGHGILSVSIKELTVLYSSYMPFLNNGGIFIPTDKTYKMNDEVFLLLSLLDEEEKIPVNGKVAWITPAHAQNNRVAGIGIQFTEKNSEAKNKIEKYLTGMMTSGKPTHTL